MSQVFFGTVPNYASARFHSDYLSLLHILDPNNGSSYMEWPRWNESRELLNTYATGAMLISDDFRSDSYVFLEEECCEFAHLTRTGRSWEVIVHKQEQISACMVALREPPYDAISPELPGIRLIYRCSL